MEAKTRNIIIVIVIIAVIVGVGVPLGVVLVAPAYGAVQTGVLVTPGAPAGVASDRIIRIGCLSAMTEIQGEGAWKGGYMAVDEINQAGGITLGGETYYFGLISEDTFEADANLDVTKGTLAAQLMLESDDPDIIYGGFRTEALSAYEEPIMDAKKIFINVGAATDDFCADVLTDYARYKYFFRISPVNSSSLVSEIIRTIGYLKSYMEAVLGKPINKAAIIREDLDWTVGMGYVLDGALYSTLGIPGLPQLGFEVVEHVAFPITATAEDFSQYWQNIETDGAQLVVPVISAQGGILMTTQYAQVQAKSLIYGINVMSQDLGFWDETGGGCEYEIGLTSLCEGSYLTPTTQVYWENFKTNYGEAPIYTASAGYNAVQMIATTIEAAQSLDSDDLVTQFESYTPDNTIQGLNGDFCFTASHDVFEGYDHTTDKIRAVSLMAQWQDGKKVCISTGGLVYPDATPYGDVVTGSIQFPDWNGDGVPDIN